MFGEKCNFGHYVDTATHDQLMCRLHDEKCQQELLGIPELTADIALKRQLQLKWSPKKQERLRQEQPQAVIFISLVLQLNVITVEKQAIIL